MAITPGGKRQKPTLDDLKWLGWLLKDSVATERSMAVRAFARLHDLPQTTVTRKLEALNDQFVAGASDEADADANGAGNGGDLFVINGEGIRLTDRGSELAVVGLIISTCLNLLDSEVDAPRRRTILRKAFQQLAGDFQSIESIIRHNKINRGSFRRHLSPGDANFDWLIRKPVKLDPEEVDEMIRLQEAAEHEEEELEARRRDEEIENEERRWCKERGIDYDEYISREGD